MTSHMAFKIIREQVGQGKLRSFPVLLVEEGYVR